MKRSFILLPLCFLLSCHLSATVLSICASGCDYPMICDGIAGASSGDTLDLQDALYTESQLFVGKNLTIQGQGSSATVVQAAATQSAAVDGVFFIQQGYTVRIRNLTIQNGKALSSMGNSSSAAGGGLTISVNSQSDVIIEGVTIQQNWAENFGGGAYVTGSGGVVRFIDCVIRDNETNSATSSSGGGFHVRNSGQLTFTRCSIINNRATRFGGGFYIGAFSSNIRLINCTISENTAGGIASTASGGGLDIWLNNTANTVELINCSVVNNRLFTSTNRLGAGVYLNRGGLILTNTLIANNTGSTSSSGKDLYCFGSVPLTITTSLVEDCFNCAVPPTYTTDPNLSSAQICEGKVYYVPQAPSAAIDGGTAPGGLVPTDDICGNTRLSNSYDLGSASSPAVFPVEMIYFSGKSQLNSHILSWETAQESNNLGFYPERSKDGQTWERIGFVEGVGTSTEISSYQFVDESPLEGLSYYRLKQVDVSGDFSYSSVIELRNTAEIEFSIYPNPARDRIEITGVSDGKGKVFIMDKWGRIVLEHEARNTQIDISELPPGHYMLMLDQGSKRSYRQLIKR